MCKVRKYTHPMKIIKETNIIIIIIIVVFGVHMTYSLHVCDSIYNNINFGKNAKMI